MIKHPGLSPCLLYSAFYVLQCCMSSAISQLLGIQTASVVMFTTESS